MALNKRVQFPRGSSTQENGITGLAGELRVDLTGGNLRVHDGAKQGGNILPNIDQIQALIAQASDGVGVTIQSYQTENDLSNAPPKANAIAVVQGVGVEDVFTWHSGAGDSGTLASSVSGHWRRLDAAVGFVIRMWRVGMINLQVNGAAPSSNQDITAWLSAGVLKLYDGASYINATPLLFARLWSKIGSYATAIVLPNQIAQILTDLADLDTAPDTGWYRSTSSATHSPVAGVHALQFFKIDSTTAVQVFWVTGSATQDRYVRYKQSGTWGSWTLVSGQLPGRLGATSALITDWNTALDSGFYKGAAGASNAPTAAAAEGICARYDSTNAIQIVIPTASNVVYTRTFSSSAWGSWSTLEVSHATSKPTLTQADKILIYDVAASDAPKQSLISSLVAAAADWRANTADKLLDTDGVWAAGAEVALTDAATIAVDMSTFINAAVTLAGNRTLGNPTNPKVSQSGFIRLVQDATGGRTLSFGANWKFANGSTPALTATANAQDILFYHVVSSTRIYATLARAVP